ncbi:E3 ubiquitin-protein ligase SIRP1-like [Impatiens glandulifera]|uniref:E3 ubiquitin-protein ligase SIRP1-like n=1 Tax=Impatiens glandulifera TaxID=253017 RepID=UPI001FB18808|nr:E3 ubiquitin-protein ligase SIRP1-like [Impatiens glandulifera]
MDGEVAAVSRYWCHRCVQPIDPVRIEAEIVECPLCHEGFLEDIPSSGLSLGVVVENTEDFGHFSDSLAGGGSQSDRRPIPLWDPILLGMMSNPGRRSRRFRPRIDAEDYDEAEGGYQENEIYREIELLRRRRRRYTATILQILHRIRARILSEPDDENNRNLMLDLNIREREVVAAAESEENSILINPFDHSIIVNGSLDSDTSFNSGSLGDYFVGPGLDLLLQHLSENDPNRYGTPPAQKEVVESMPTVKIEECLQCCICLDDFEVGKEEAKEMPCKHKFHGECILPWLKLHSTCPVCRYQLPFEEPKLDRGADISRGYTMPVRWPSSSSSAPGSASRTRNENGSASRTRNEN